MSSSLPVTLNGVACTIPEFKGVKMKNVGGMQVPDVKTGLQQLSVVLPTVQQTKVGEVPIAQGQKVWVSTQALMSFPWAKETYEIDGVFFIVVPIEYVVALK